MGLLNFWVVVLFGGDLGFFSGGYYRHSFIEVAQFKYRTWLRLTIICFRYLHFQVILCLIKQNWHYCAKSLKIDLSSTRWTAHFQCHFDESFIQRKYLDSSSFAITPHLQCVTDLLDLEGRNLLEINPTGCLRSAVHGSCHHLSWSWYWVFDFTWSNH